LEDADSVGGQLCEDKKCCFGGVTSSGSLEEGAGKEAVRLGVWLAVCFQHIINTKHTITKPM